MGFLFIYSGYQVTKNIYSDTGVLLDVEIKTPKSNCSWCKNALSINKNANVKTFLTVGKKKRPNPTTEDTGHSRLCNSDQHTQMQQKSADQVNAPHIP